MKLAEIVNTILKEADRLVSKKKFANKKEFEDNVETLLSSIKSDIVYLRFLSKHFKEDENKQEWNFKFQIIFSLNDKYIDNKAYSSGSVFIFPNEKLYNDIDELSEKLFYSFPQWDEAKTVATISGEIKVY
jgi:hypothetical protein